MKYLLASAALVWVLATPVWADIVDDPLHGMCAGCTETNVGGTPVTVLGPNGVTGFGFSSSPPGASGNLELKFLIPDNFTQAQVSAFATLVNVTGVGGPFNIVQFTSAQFGSTWTAADGSTIGLEEFLGHTGVSPPNPLNAWLPATQTLQPTATGYYVLLAETGQHTLAGQNDPLSAANTFSLNPDFYPSGGLIAANMFEANGNIISTAQSSALFFNGLSSGPFCTNCTAVPLPLAGAGIPGLLSALSLVGLAWRRRRRNLDLA